MTSVVIFRTSDKTWYLQTYNRETSQVYMLLPFKRFIEALNTAQALQLHVDEIELTDETLTVDALSA
jgi:hypothetical protein